MGDKWHASEETAVELDTVIPCLTRVYSDAWA